MGSLRSYKTLKYNENFANIYKSGKKWHCECAVIFYKKTLEKSVGFVASKKVGNAVKRNRTRRRLKGLFLAYQDRLKSGTYIFIAKPSAISLNHEELKRNITWAFKKMDLLK